MPDLIETLEDGVRYQLGGALDSALESFRAVIDQADTPELVAEALRREAHVHRVRCQWDAALDAARRSASVAERHGLASLRAEARNAEAAVHQSRGDFDLAVDILHAVLEETGDERIRGVALQNLGSIAALRGDHQAAERLFLSSYRYFGRAEYRRGQAIALNNYGRAALERGEAEVAARVFEGAVRAARSVSDLELIALATLNAAEALASAGAVERASDEVAAALGHFLAVGNVFRQVECYRLMGDLALTLGRDTVAERCFHIGLELALSVGARHEEGQLRERIAALPAAPARPWPDDRG